jgi:hypothetical protein
MLFPDCLRGSGFSSSAEPKEKRATVSAMFEKDRQTEEVMDRRAEKAMELLS